MDYVIPIDYGLRNDSNEHLYQALDDAKRHLNFYHWVSSINEEYVGAEFEGIIYIFLFKISSNRDDVDPWLWVVVGDIPPAYITCESALTPNEALDSYLGAMEEWVEAARNGESVEKLVPVNVPATPKNGEMLSIRLAFLDQKILPLVK